MSFEDLQLLRRCARTNRKREIIVKLMNHEVEVYSLFPVDVGIANRQLLRVLSKDFDFCVVFWRRSVAALDVLFPNKEQQIIGIDRLFLILEQEVAHENLRPLSVSLQHNKSRV